MGRKSLLGVATFCLLLAQGQAKAGTVAVGFDSTSLGACDDCYSSAINVGFTMDFFGTSTDTLFVNNNGNITFNNGQFEYTPYGIGSGYSGDPIIAPFFADVDTRGAGSGITAYGSGTYSGKQAFGVTWPSVGYYGAKTDKLNTFQLLLVNRADIATGDFDIYFNYGSIQWETGDASGGSDGLGGTSAAVGYSNGTSVAGTYYEFPGSLVNGAFLDGGPDALSTGTNDGTPGQYLFEVRNGMVMTGVPEPSTWAMMLIGVAGLGYVGYRRTKRKADVTFSAV